MPQAIFVVEMRDGGERGLSKRLIRSFDAFGREAELFSSLSQTRQGCAELVGTGQLAQSLQTDGNAVVPGDCRQGRGPTVTLIAL
jgi:hypothetical protein